MDLLIASNQHSWSRSPRFIRSATAGIKRYKKRKRCFFRDSPKSSRSVCARHFHRFRRDVRQRNDLLSPFSLLSPRWFIPAGSISTKRRANLFYSRWREKMRNHFFWMMRKVKLIRGAVIFFCLGMECFQYNCVSPSMAMRKPLDKENSY